MTQKNKKVTMGQIGVLLAGNKKKSLMKASSSSGSVSDLESKKGKKKKTSDNAVSTTNTAVPDEPDILWNSEIAHLSLSKYPFNWKKATKVLEKVKRKRQKVKLSQFTIKRKCMATRDVVVSYPASLDSHSVPFVKTKNEGIRLGKDGRILPHCILGSEEEYERQVNTHEGTWLEEEFEKGQHLTAKSRQSKKAISEHVYSQHVHEDKALDYYSNSMVERKIQRCYISGSIQRNEEELVMGDYYKQWEPSKRVLNYSVTPNYWHVDDTDPRFTGFWKLKVPIGSELGGLHSTLLLSEQGYPPPRTLVNVPASVRQEKDLGKPQRAKQNVYTVPDTDLWIRGSNNPDREPTPLANYIQDKSTLHYPQPIFSDEYWRNKLYVEPDGTWKSFSQCAEVEETSAIPTITITGDRNDCPKIRISGKEAEWYPPYDRGVTVHTEAGIEGPVNQILSSTLRLDNCGCTVIHFSWQKIFKIKPFGVQRQSKERFYFDDQEGIVVPGETKYISVMFKSSVPGLYSEQWKLICRPTLCGKGDIIVTLWAVAIQEDVNLDTRNEIENDLSRRVADTIVMEVIDNMVKSVKTPTQSTDPYHGQLPTGSGLFHYNNKQLSYNSTEVEELLNIADSTSPDHPFNKWTVSVDRLYKLIQSVECEDDLLSPDEENPVVLKQGQNTLLTRFNDVVARLSFSPAVPFLNEKYNICYGLLGNSVDEFSMVGEKLKRRYGRKVEKVEAVKDIPEEPPTPLTPKKSPKEKDTKEKKDKGSSIKADKDSSASKHKPVSSRSVAPTPVPEKLSEPENLIPEDVFILKDDPEAYKKYTDKLYIACRTLVTDLVMNLEEHLSQLHKP